ncbi:MAG TPA: EAL domain-containing protein [Longimicrobiales bacterium]|nr:EAL domain-containing protein [Longimicrobiales bacterium]
MNPDPRDTTGSARLSPESDDVTEAETRVRRQQNAAAVEAARHAFRSARAQEGRLAFLAGASMVLGSSLDSAQTIDHIARLAVPELGDLCIVDLVQGTQLQRRAAAVHDDPAIEPQLQVLLTQRRLAPGSPQQTALTSGTAQLGAVSDDHELPWSERSAEGRLLRALGVQSYLVLPIRSRARTLGLLTLLSTTRRGYTAEEFTTAGEFVHRSAVALDNALLYGSESTAREAAEVAKAQYQSLINGFRESEDKYRKLFEESKGAAARLRESEHFTRTIISSVRQGIIVYDRELRYQVWNRFMEEITGLPAADVIGTHALDIFPELREHGIDLLLQRALQGATVQSPDTPFDVPQTGKSGWVATVYSPHIGPDGSVMGVVAIIHDITERKRAEDQLHHNAFHDALTGLPNRALFVDRLERLLSHSVRHPEAIFAVAFLDLDRFKIVNDSLGHVVGDELLVAIGQRIRSCIRAVDTVARLGGDEFAVLLADVKDVREATRVAERILMAMSTPFHLASHEVYATASIGIALSSTGYEKPEDILRDADTAMYRAKMGGRTRYEVFDRMMHANAVRTLQLETDLRRALERREFRVHYQPIISLSSGRITGFEALVRWQHPTQGLVAPGEFVPLAEETGLIVSIGWWVLEEACRQMQHWLDLFPGRTAMTMSVNLSTRQFMQPDLLEQVDTVLSLSGLPPHALKLEITESAVVQHESTVGTALAALRARGIQLCIDDFGTGYSSLSYLHAFPVDTLKIDRSFVSQIGFGGSNSRLVETIVALSRNLGMNSVAEGVETNEQLAFLRATGSEFAQGFLFSKACTPADIVSLLERDPVW